MTLVLAPEIADELDRRVNETRYTYPGFNLEIIKARVQRVNEKALDEYLKDWKKNHTKWADTLDWYLSL